MAVARRVNWLPHNESNGRCAVTTGRRATHQLVVAHGISWSLCGVNRPSHGAPTGCHTANQLVVARCQPAVARCVNWLSRSVSIGRCAVSTGRRTARQLAVTQRINWSLRGANRRQANLISRCAVSTSRRTARQLAVTQRINWFARCQPTVARRVNWPSRSVPNGRCAVSTGRRTARQLAVT